MSSVDVHRAASLDTFEPRDPSVPHLVRPQLSLPSDHHQQQQQQQLQSHSSVVDSPPPIIILGGGGGGGGGGRGVNSSGTKLRQKQRHSLKELNAMRRAATAAAATSSASSDTAAATSSSSSTSNNNCNSDDAGYCYGASRGVKIRLPNGMVSTDTPSPSSTAYNDTNNSSGSSNSSCERSGVNKNTTSTISSSSRSGACGAQDSTVDPVTMGCHSNNNRNSQKHHHHPSPLSPNLLRVCEVEDDLSDWESPIDVDLASNPKSSHQSSWRKIRSFILWSPFIQVFKKHRYPWIQLAGHQGNFQAGDAGSVLKRLDKREQQCFHKLMSDSLRDYVPEYRGNVDKNGDTFIQLQDLLCTFTYPCVMDIKMGVRTYLEEELHKARKSPALRKDMYQKMLEVDTNAPTQEEHDQKAVTKPRYMQWRDEMSSSAQLGFRVEGIKQSDGKSSKDFKKTKEREDIVEIIQAFVGSNEKIVEKYLDRLRQIRRAQEASDFFNSHEVVGSSLLFVHDADESVNVWMIDFGKTEQLPSGTAINHRSLWQEGNREDGYLFGLDNLVTVFDELYKNLSSTTV